MKDDRGTLRYDCSDPSDLAALISNGAVWSGGEECQQLAVDALVSGAVPMNDRVPDDVRGYIESKRTNDE